MFIRRFLFFFAFLLGACKASTPSSEHPKLPKNVEILPTVVVVEEDSEGESKYSSYEVHATSTGFETTQFAKGFYVATGSDDTADTWRIQESVVDIPTFRNCDCGVIPDCTPQGMDRRVVLTSKSDDRQIILNSPLISSETLGFTYKNSRFYVQGRSLSVTVCYEKMTCNMHPSLYCENHLFDLSYHLSKANLTPFQELAPMPPLLQQRRDTIPHGSPVFDSIDEAIRNKLPLQLSEVIFRGDYLIRRWVLPLDSLVRTYNTLDQSLYGPWSDGTLSLSDTVYLDGKIHSLLANQLTVPRHVAIFSSDKKAKKKAKVVGWSLGTLE